jgi:FtsP/CotA-like multicopper oxidase with cupredoxin domain
VKKLLYFLLLVLSGHRPSGAAPSISQAAHANPAPGPQKASTGLRGKVTEYDLEIAEQVVEPAGKKIRALTINGKIPGPTLHFQEGDWARIRVHNRLPHSETSLHWHGLLVPNVEDGVPHLATPPILQGHSRTFEFRLRQAGTYWYHSHTGLQEQQAVYGAIVVSPRVDDGVRADREQVLVLSDWTNERPDEVLRTLKRNSNWYAIKKGTAQSLLGAYRRGALGEYLRREKSRMPPMDVSDVAYDAFLINGRQQLRLAGRPGETVRVRLINASAATYFYVQSAAAPLQIISTDGLAVQPVAVKRLLVGIAETYDFLLQIPRDGTWELRASAQDGSGMARAFFGSGTLHPAPEVPKPDLYRMDDMLTASLAELEGGMPHVRGKGAGLTGNSGSEEMARPLSPYRQLRSPASTALPLELPRRSIKLHLTGDMQRYIWSFNGKTIDQESVISVKRGEVLRMELINDTMMHHPIHLHGHFFRLLNGQGDHSPLKHTVDVPPMGRRIIEFEANEEGDWMFHCHVLYHMMEGMARVVSYRSVDSNGETPGLHMGEHALPMFYAFSDFNVLSNRSDGVIRLLAGRNSLILGWEAQWSTFPDTARYDTELLYERYLNPNAGLLTGLRRSRRGEADNAKTRALAGGWYRLPYLVIASATLDSQGGVRVELAKSFQLSARLSLDSRGRYDARDLWEGAATLNYSVTKNVTLSGGYHSESGFGGGLTFRL